MLRRFSLEQSDIYTQSLTNHIGKPYIWGANGLDAFDCSGWVLYVLRFLGENVPDMTAAGLYERTCKHVVGDTPFGALAFYGPSPEKITHVAFCLGNDLIIESGGGGRDCTTAEEAKRRGAGVRIRTLLHRSDLRAVTFPEYKILQEDTEID